MLSIVLFFCCVYVANAETKDTGITIHMENTSLAKIFKEIERQSGYCFFYNASLVKGTDKMTIQITNATIQEVLVGCLESLGLEHRISGRIITLRASADKESDEKESSPKRYYFFVIIPFGSRRVRRRLKRLVYKWLKK